MKTSGPAVGGNYRAPRFFDQVDDSDSFEVVQNDQKSSNASASEDDDIIYQVEKANYLAESQRKPNMNQKKEDVRKSDNDPLALQSTEVGTGATGIGRQMLLRSQKHTSVPVLDQTVDAVDMTVDLRNWQGDVTFVRSLVGGDISTHNSLC